MHRPSPLNKVIKPSKKAKKILDKHEKIHNKRLTTLDLTKSDMVRRIQNNLGK